MNVVKPPAKRPVEAQIKSEPATDRVTLVDSIPAEVHEAPAEKTVASAPRPSAPQQPKPTVAPHPQPDDQKRKSAGFLPLVLGGIVAGAIGYGVSTLTNPAVDSTIANQVAMQATAIEALKQQIASASQIDLSAIEATQADLGTKIAAIEADLATRIAGVEERTAVLEQLPRSAGGAFSQSTAAFEEEIDALRSQMSEMTDAAQTQLDAARAEAKAIEENAAAAAQNATLRAAIARVQSSLETGGPIGAALGDLETAMETRAPAALLAVQDGVATMDNLRATFPDAARAALSAARDAGASGEETGGFRAFLRDQFDVRSTAPREGSDADAILSRAAAALDAGRLTDALAEIGALPEVSRAALSGWLSKAEARAAAIAAADTLSSNLSDN